jgi:hypothetical protein
MHILFIPKWYPWERDPQLGDFLRKQAIAVARHAKVSVLHVALDPDMDRPYMQEVAEKDGLWSCAAVTVEADRVTPRCGGC